MKVQTCIVWDEATQTCTQTAWVDQSSALPVLSIADAQSIGMACALLWATAFVFRIIRKALQQFN